MYIKHSANCLAYNTFLINFSHIKTIIMLEKCIDSVVSRTKLLFIWLKICRINSHALLLFKTFF